MRNVKSYLDLAHASKVADIEELRRGLSIAVEYIANFETDIQRGIDAGQVAGGYFSGSIYDDPYRTILSEMEARGTQ